MADENHKTPSDIAAEKAVLGAIILLKEAYWVVADKIRSEMFYYPNHISIYSAIERVVDKGKSIDLVTVGDQLRSDGCLDSVGGFYYLSELTSRVANSANIGHHAFIIKQHWQRRRQIQTGRFLIKEALRLDDPAKIYSEATKQLDQAASSGISGITKMSELAIEALKEIETTQQCRQRAVAGDRKFISGLESGIHDLDFQLDGFQNGDLVIIAARPAMGKTALVLQMLSNLSKEAAPVVLFSLEMSKMQLVKRHIATETRIDQMKIRTGRLSGEDWQKITSLDFPENFYVDDTPALSIEDLRVRGRRMKAEGKIKLLAVDYLQLMKGRREYRGNREQEISGISRSLKELARELEIPVIALSQLSRAVESRGGDKKPMLSDLRESGAIEQDADVVMFLYRPEYYGLGTYEDGSSTAGVAEIIVAKQRNGPAGTVKIGFNKETISFFNLNENPF